jgi:two-component system, OmpR family, sensor kinase
LSGSVPPAKDNPWRHRLGARSLTARLSIGVVALVLVLVAAIGTTTYFALRPFLYDRLDQQLDPIAAGNATRLEQCINSDQFNLPCPIGGGPAHYSAPQTEWIVGVTSTGRQVVYPQRDTEPVKYLHLSLSDRLYLYSHPDLNMTVSTTDGYQVRVTGRQLETPPDSPQVVVVSGLSTDNVRKTLGRLIAIELIIGAAAVVIALFATLYGVRFGLRRLRRVTSTANDVAAELSPTGSGLNRRVDVPNDGTEVGQLAESVNTLLSAVETQFAARLRSEARLRQFLADASHELRTPLTSIRGYAELARMQKAAGADAEDNLARIESEGTRMSRLVEDLLLLARGEQPVDAEPVRELVDLAELLDDVASTSRAAFPERRVTVEAAPGQHIVGDPDQLLRAIRNLVANAAMHTAEGRSILIRAFHDGTDIVIQVVDGGPGLPPEQAAHVFERFWRADKARSRVRGGTGLGLAIVAAIVAAHGGWVRFDSSVEQGSTVTIRLPEA